MVLTTDNLHKEFGRITAVNRLNLEIEAGTVFGLLGPNGSGKTTTLAMILGVTNPTSGSYTWFGKENDHKQRRRIGSILEKPNFYPNFSGYKNLQLACKIKEVSQSRIDPLLEQVGLIERKDYAFKTYSLGMKQRLAIASALLADPEVLILDEPTNGLDPSGISEIRALIMEIAQSGKTIILASHLLDEVQKVCSEFCILKSGKLIYQGHVEADFANEVKIEIAASDMIRLESIVPNYKYYLSHKNGKNKLEVSCRSGAEASDLNYYLVQQGIPVTHIATIKKNLEQQFMEILSKENGETI